MPDDFALIFILFSTKMLFLLISIIELGGMRAYFKLLVLLIVSFLTYESVSSQDNIRFLHYGKKDGLSQNAVFAIAQDGRGVMWFGTREGLNEYDGYHFKVYKHKPGDTTSLVSDDIRVLSFDGHRNCLWIGTPDGLSQYEFKNGRFNNFQNRPSEPSKITDNIIRNVFVDSMGRVWLATAEGLDMLLPGEETFQRIQLQNAKDLDIKAVLEVENEILIGTQKGLFVFPNKSKIDLPPVPAKDLYPELAALFVQIAGARC